MKVKVKRRALRRTAGPGTAAAGPGDRRGGPFPCREAEPARGNASAEPLGREPGASRGAGAEGAGSVLREDDAGAAGGSALRQPGCRGSLPAGAAAGAGGGPRP